MALVSLDNIEKTFGARSIFDRLSFQVDRGERVGLIGDNGAGKSTLISIVSGAAQPDEGTILVNGKEHVFADAIQARAAGIETVFQTLALAPTLDITENVYLGRELLRGGALGRLLRWMDKRTMRRRVAEGFERLGLTLPPLSTKVGALSGGQRQAVAIARAVLWGSKIVMLDEPTAALGAKQIEIVLTFVKRLKEHGVAVVYISHNMQHVLRVADRVVVLRLGHKVFDGERTNLTGPQLVGLMTGALVEETAPAA